MTENRRYYYLKLKESFYSNETMVILESMQDGFLYSNLLLKLYLMALKNNGVLMLNDHLAHTPQTIATCTRHQTGTVERALKVFIEFGLVEVLTDGAFYMTDMQLLIGQSSTEGERKKKERMKLEHQKRLPGGPADTCPANGEADTCPPNDEADKCPANGEADTCPPNDEADKCPSILEYREKEIRDKEIREGERARAFGRYRNVFLTEAELAQLQAELPAVWNEYSEKLSAYMESTGRKYKSHAATIRRWASEDNQKVTGKQKAAALGCAGGLPDYSYKEGESL